MVDFRFGRELRRLRLERGLSLGELAELVHYSKGHLSKIENGHSLPTVPLARSCDAILCAEGRLVAVATTDEEPGVAVEAAPDAAWILRMNPDGSGLFEIEESPGPPVTVITALAGFSTDPMPGLVAVFDGIRTLGRSASPSMVLPMAVTQAHIATAAARRSSNTDRVRLLQHAAHTSEYAGWMAQECGDDRGAVWWTERAVALATAAGDSGMQSYALVRAGVLSLYRIDSAAAIGSTEQVLEDGAVSPRIRWLAALGAAQGYAIGSDQVNALRALERAALLWEQANSSGADEHFGPSSLAGRPALIEAWCHYDLGNLELAAQLFEAGMAGVRGQSDRDRARFGTRRALVHAALGDAARACELIEPLLDVIRAVDSATIRADLQDFARTVRRCCDPAVLQRVEPTLRDALARR